MKFQKLVSIISSTALLTTLGAISFSDSAKASGFTSIRIGDRDGFGYTRARQGGEFLNGADGNRANRDFDPNNSDTRFLGDGDVLPDLNGDGKMATGSEDNFDYRSNREKRNNFLTGNDGYINNGSSGSAFTDISLSRSKTNEYLKDLNKLRPRKELIEKIIELKDKGKTKNQIRNNPKVQELKEQVGGLNSLLNQNVTELETENTEVKKEIRHLNKLLKNVEKPAEGEKIQIPQPVFKFDFLVNESEVDKENPFYFNLLFADYDVKGAQIELKSETYNETITLPKQKNQEGDDGLIQEAFMKLNFEDIFTTTDVEGQYRGYLEAKVIAPEEPYMAFDFAEISTKKAKTNLEFAVAEPQAVPEPTTIFGLIAVGAFGANSLNKRKKK